MFDNRLEAGLRLAAVLGEFRNKENAIVIAIPRGGVVTGYAVAKKLHLPLDVAMVKKLGHPQNPEFAIGAVSIRHRTIDEHISVPGSYIEEETQRIRKLLAERYRYYHGDQPPPDLHGKTVIIVDDGVATGKTLIACLDLVKQEKPEKVVVAVPVGPTRTIDHARRYADQIVCLREYDDFFAIGMHYKDFKQVSDPEVRRLLKLANRERRSSGIRENGGELR